MCWTRTVTRYTAPLYKVKQRRGYIVSKSLGIYFWDFSLKNRVCAARDVDRSSLSEASQRQRLGFPWHYRSPEENAFTISRKPSVDPAVHDTAASWRQVFTVLRNGLREDPRIKWFSDFCVINNRSKLTRFICDLIQNVARTFATKFSD